MEECSSEALDANPGPASAPLWRDNQVGFNSEGIAERDKSQFVKCFIANISQFFDNIIDNVASICYNITIMLFKYRSFTVNKGSFKINPYKTITIIWEITKGILLIFLSFLVINFFSTPFEIVVVSGLFVIYATVSSGFLATTMNFEVIANRQHFPTRRNRDTHEGKKY